MRKKLEPDKVNDTFLSKLKPEDLRVVYEQYSFWGRHNHSLIWISTSFGIGIAVGGLSFYDKVERYQFIALGIACLSILYTSYLIADRNRRHWLNHWKVLNMIEGHWGIRNLTENTDGPLVGFEDDHRRGQAKNARVLLMYICAGIWIAAAILKFFTVAPAIK